MTPLISIIIPTRQRCLTLSACIRTALDQIGSLEVIVSDNASEDRTADVVRQFDDPRLFYFKTPRRLSMADSYEFATSHARGQYLILIGDDDGIMPEACARLSGMIEETGSDIYAWDPHTYIWPIDSEPASFTLTRTSQSQKSIDIRKLARESVRHGSSGWQQLPKLYHAAVSRKVLDELQSRTGRIFHTTQPDVFLAYALPAFRTHAQYIANPITINGRSAASTGYAAIVAGNDARSSAIVRAFIDEYGMSYKLDESLSPFMPEGLNWIADTILAAMKMFPDLYKNVSFNYSAFYASWAAHGPWRRFDRIARTIRARNQIRRYHRFGILAYLSNWALIRLKQGTGTRLSKLHNRNTIFSDQRPSDVWECAQLFGRN